MLQITDHQQRAVDRLIEQYRSKTTYPAVVRLMTAEHQVIENETWGLYTETLASAADHQLKVWARLVGQALDAAWDDALFLEWIRFRIVLNAGGSTGDEIISAFKSALVDGVDVELVEQFPAALKIRLGAAVPVLRWAAALEDLMPAGLATPLAFGDIVAGPAFFAALLRALKAAGVRGVVEWLNTEPANTFTLDAGPGLDVGILADSVQAR